MSGDVAGSRSYVFLGGFPADVSERQKGSCDGMKRFSAKAVWRSWPRKGQEKTWHPHMDWGREMAYINHFYFYLWDSEWGGAFWKTNAYSPFPM